MRDGWVRVVIGIAVIGGLWRINEEDVSETYDFGRLEGVTGVTLRVWVVVVVGDS